MNEIKRQQEIEETLQVMADAIQYTIDKHTPGMGFGLLLFDFYEPGIGHYISNSERTDMIKALRETANRLEARQDIPPGHKTTQ